MVTVRPVKVYAAGEAYRKVVTLAQQLEYTSRYQDADIVLVDKWEEIPEGFAGVIFTTNAAVFQKSRHAVGAFYWEHGRPKIYFLRKRLKAKGIDLSAAMQRYLITELP